ncbi:hypothetical protein ABZU05_04720 [Sneathia vaginalis]|uniref:hypothetical protein n=1 Tax=Sneathia vaginalis TaxID=187101 RepID=UPI0035C6FA5B
MKIKIFKYLGNESNIQISMILFILTYILSFKFDIFKILLILSSILLSYILIKLYFKEGKFILLPFIFITLDILVLSFFKFGILHLITYVLSIIAITYSEYRNFNNNGIYDSIELSVVYTILKLIIFIRMFFR